MISLAQLILEIKQLSKLEIRKVNIPTNNGTFTYQFEMDGEEINAKEYYDGTDRYIAFSVNFNRNRMFEYLKQKGIPYEQPISYVLVNLKFCKII